MWHATKESAERCSTSMCFPEVLLQKEIFNKKMNHFKQAMVRSFICNIEPNLI
jgi:hypothetical protein